MAFDWYGALERVANFEDTIPYVVHECSCYITGGTLRLDCTLRSRCGKSRMGWGWGVATGGRDGIATRSWCYETICLQTEALGQKKPAHCCWDSAWLSNWIQPGHLKKWRPINFPHQTEGEPGERYVCTWTWRHKTRTWKQRCARLFWTWGKQGPFDKRINARVEILKT